MPKNTDAQARRRRQAWHSTVGTTLWLLLAGTALLILRYAYDIQGFPGAVMAIFALLDYGMTIPIWILLKTRLREIEGGEEDAAAEY